MKKIIIFLLMELSLSLLSNARADIIFSGEEPMKALPRIFKNKFPTEDNCPYNGKRAGHIRGQGDLWFIANSCMGSGGALMAIALVSAGNIRTLLDTGAESTITIKDTLHEGFPDLEVSGASHSMGIHADTFRYNGKSYVAATHYQDIDLSLVPMAEVPEGLRIFFTKLNQKSDCIQAELTSEASLAGYNINSEEFVTEKNKGAPDGYIVTSDCMENGKQPIWVLSTKPTPHAVLHLTVANFATLRTGPGSGHGFSDICAFDNDRQCWHYDGTIYRPAQVVSQ